jgi:hypothetical protein
MIELSPVLQDILSQPIQDLSYLVQIGDQGLVSITSHYSDVELRDGTNVLRTYQSDGRLIRIDPPAITSAVDRSSYKIYFADPNFLDGVHAEGLGHTPWISQSVEIRAVFTNTTEGNKVDSKGYSIKPDQLYDQLEDTMIVYSGYIDDISYQINTQTLGESLLVISCSSPMYNLDFKRSFRLNKDFISSRNPKDSCCDRIYEGSSKVRLMWGKS